MFNRISVTWEKSCEVESFSAIVDAINTLNNEEKIALRELASFFVRNKKKLFC
jgi:nucleoid DNA-binding protein